MKYTKEILEPVVKKCLSYNEVARNFLERPSGSAQVHFKKIIIKFGLDTSHFLGQGRNRGKDHKGGPDKLLPEQVLVLNRCSGRKEKTSKLRRAMLENGIKYECKFCGINDNWKDKPLTLEIDHVNGNYLDNRLENVRFLCPNCHSQTETHSKRK